MVITIRFQIIKKVQSSLYRQFFGLLSIVQIFWTEVAFTIQNFGQLCFDKFSICFITPILSFCQEFYSREI